MGLIVSCLACGGFNTSHHCIDNNILAFIADDLGNRLLTWSRGRGGGGGGESTGVGIQSPLLTTKRYELLPLSSAMQLARLLFCMFHIAYCYEFCSFFFFFFNSVSQGSFNCIFPNLFKHKVTCVFCKRISFCFRFYESRC